MNKIIIIIFGLVIIGQGFFIFKQQKILTEYGTKINRLENRTIEETDLSEIEDRLDDLETDVSSNKSSISDLESKTTNISTFYDPEYEIRKLKSRIDDLEWKLR